MSNTTRYEIALWQGPHFRPLTATFFGYSARITKTVIAQLLQDNGPTVLDIVHMPDDFEFSFAPKRVLLNNGWIFGATMRTENDVRQETKHNDLKLNAGQQGAYDNDQITPTTST